MSAPKYIIDYNAQTGDPFPDGDVKDLASVAIGWELFDAENPYVVCASTDNIVTEFRYRVANGEIALEDIQFEFNGERVEMNRFGCIESGFPDGYCDTVAKRSEAIIRAAAARRRADRTASAS